MTGPAQMKAISISIKVNLVITHTLLTELRVFSLLIDGGVPMRFLDEECLVIKVNR